MWPNDRPGLGVEFDSSRAQLALEVTRKGGTGQLFQRPDGSYTNW
jgi:hypothetical protein